ncbi:hypothetical protein BKA82DRAFT_4144429 [Pisolithus tinctorius]|nr:hypothetical protein BKA82DRAFT_4144429 [Pisolithus tinctorius]
MPDEISPYAFQHDIVGAYYIPEFISREEEVHLLRKIGESPKHKWKTLCNRRCVHTTRVSAGVCTSWHLCRRKTLLVTSPLNF